MQNNGGDNLSILANGNFTFPTALDNGSGYAVSIQAQPSGQACVVNNAGGTLSGANVINVAVSCGAIAVGLSTSHLDLGTLIEGSTSSAQLIVTNIGAGNLVLSSITAPAAPFSIVGGSCLALPFTLAAGAQCTVDVTFAPTTLGTFSSSLLIHSNAASSPTEVTMSGTLLAATAVPVSNPLALLLLGLALAWMASMRFNAARNGGH